MEAIAPGQGSAVKKIFLRKMKNPHDQNVVQTDLVQGNTIRNRFYYTIEESTLRYIKRKANQSVDCVMEAIAPGQGSAVKKIFLRKMKNPHDQNVVQTDLVQGILQLYNATTDNRIRRQLLALISKQLKACAASKRTSLHGLDNIAAEGSEGYDNLINLVEDLHRMNVINSEESKELTTSITSSIDIKEYSYSEPQAGKSYCDSKIAHMRTKMKTFVASGKDVITAKYMKVAIDDGSGVVGCQVAYVTVDSTKQTLTSHKWKGVNAYTDIKYEENVIRVYRAHSIGTGSFLSHAEINKLTSSFQENTKLVVLDDFSLPSKIDDKIKVQLNAEQDTVVPTQELAVENTETTTVVSIPDAQIFSCPETGCVKIYRTFSGLEAHMLFGKHALKLERISTFDEVRIQWASICNEVCVTLKTPLCQGGTCSTNMG
ncbi:uncharacterized protein LOC127723920 [Mytilus californianus]|uniref:uncharacterized protein LOC127723920 n=1 Tax=Mytilus californianus TaxID=6549 RepID=UPI0022468224|nr:uncharacterized protein LOC127723920 [Mytilus californianus]